MTIGLPAASDPKGFRTEAFEQDVVRPLEDSLPVGLFEAGGWPPSSHGALALLLLLESDEWLSQGQRVGYFAPPSQGTADYLENVRSVAKRDDLQRYFTDASD